MKAMYKLFFLLLISLATNFAYGQHKYVISFKGNMSYNDYDSSYDLYYYEIYDGNNRIYLKVPSSKNFDVEETVVFESSYPINSINIRITAPYGTSFSIPGSQYDVDLNINSCLQSPNFDSGYISVKWLYFMFSEIPDFAQFNFYNPNNTTQGICQSINLSAVQTNCPAVFPFAIEASIGDFSFTDPLELAPFRVDRYSYSFSLKSISGLNPNQVLYVRARYTADRNPEPKYYSKILAYDIIACSPKLIGNPSTTNTTCFGSNNGSVTLTFDKNVDVVNGYQMRYFVYEGNPNDFPTSKLNDQTQPVISGVQVVDDPLIALNTNFEGKYSGLGSGNYFIVYQEVRYDYPNIGDVDVKSGEITPQFTIEQPSEVTVAISNIDQPKCTGDTGSVTLSASGGGEFGVGQLEYSIQGTNIWQTAPIFNNLAQGRTYLFLARRTVNSTTCTSPTSVQQKIHTVSFSLGINSNTGFLQQPSGPSATDGSLRIVTENGTANYTYVLFDENDREVARIENSANAFEDFTGLGIGNYYAVVADDNGCTASSNPILLEAIPPPQLGVPVVTQISCSNDTDGAITIPISGGTTPYTYQWTRNGVSYDLGTTSNNNISISNLDGGTYMLTVASNGVDINNPNVTVSVEVSLENPDEVVIMEAVPTNISCHGASDGTIRISATGGTSYKYVLNADVDWRPLINNEIPVAQGGFYRVILQNENGCESNTMTDILVDEPDELLITGILPTNISTIDGNDGAIDITVAGGMHPYSYSWTGPNGFSVDTEDISNLSPGDYQVIVSDNNGCTVSSQTIAISEPEKFSVNLAETVFLDCYGDANAELSASVAGGIAPYTYQWFRVENGNDTDLNKDAAIISYLVAGEYYVKVTDANNNTIGSPIFEIVQPQALDIVLDDITEVLCNGDSSGTIAVTVSGGSLPYIINWDSGQTTDDITDLPAGDYTIEVEDGNGCIQTKTYTINSIYEPLEITDFEVSNGTGYQADDGHISIVLEGGSPPYAISWVRQSNGQNVGNTTVISNLPPDEYLLNVTDTNGCTFARNFTISQPDIVEESITPPTCVGNCDGSIAILVNRGNGNFTYEWSTGATTSAINDLCPGTYTVTVSGVGDGPLVRNYTVEEPLPLEVALGEDRVLCAGQELVLDASVPDETATYQWTSDNGFSSTDASITIKKTGNYSVTVSTNSGCTATGSVFVDIGVEKISAEFAVSSQVFVGETVVGVDISYPVPESLEWVLPKEATVIKQDADEVELSFANPGEYEIGIVTKRGSCQAMQTKKVLVLEKDGSIETEVKDHPKRRINDFILYPNPTTGQFTADVVLNETGQIGIKVFSFANNALMASKKDNGKVAYSMPFDLSGLPSGVYAVLLETPYGNALRKVILK